MGIIDLGNMAQVGAVPPDGSYLTRITKIDAQASKKGDSTNLFITLEIEKASDPEASDWVGKEIKTLINVQESTLWSVQAFLEAVTEREWRDEDMSFDPDDLIGSQVWAEGVEGDYNNRPQFNVKNWYPVSAQPDVSEEPF